MRDGKTAQAVCPYCREIHLFDVVEDHLGKMAWCVHCRHIWPLSELGGVINADDRVAVSAGRMAADLDSPRYKSKVPGWIS